MSGLTPSDICLIVAAFFLGLGAWTVLGAWCFVWVFRMVFLKKWEVGDEEEERGHRTEEGA